MKSLYQTLEVSENASSDEIKKSYRRLARKFHPDINKEKGAEERFKEINAAYEVLSDPKKKAQYDNLGDSMFGGQNFSDFAQNSGVDFEDLMRNIFGDGMRSSRGFGGFSGGFGGFDFGMQDLDIRANLKIPLKTAVLGGKEKISLNNQSFEIKIPPGIRSNDTIRAAKKGHQANGRVGDLLLTIEVLEDSEYQIDGDNLHKSIDIPLRTALFGGAIDVSTLYKDVRLKIPQNTRNNQKFRIKEQGAKNRKTNAFGDLILSINIKLPDVKNLSDELKELLDRELPKDLHV
ncbi:MAG: J domain-containing protein [Helicobacter sp.]|nr:J domain-containing protein [Helicobacter sp.]